MRDEKGQIKGKNNSVSFRIKTNQRMRLSSKANVLREVFGTFKFSKSVDEMMKEDDKLLYEI